jgi:hypothetical protein
LGYLSGVLRRHRKQTGSKNRALTAGQQALMTLAYLKNAHTFAARSRFQRRDHDRVAVRERGG